MLHGSLKNLILHVNTLSCGTTGQIEEIFNNVRTLLGAQKNRLSDAWANTGITVSPIRQQISKYTRSLNVKGGPFVLIKNNENLIGVIMLISTIAISVFCIVTGGRQGDVTIGALQETTGEMNKAELPETIPDTTAEEISVKHLQDINIDDSDVRVIVPENIYDESDHLTNNDLAEEFHEEDTFQPIESLERPEIDSLYSLIEAYAGNLSPVQSRVINTALLAVGRIPYKLGGNSPKRPAVTEVDETGFARVPDDAVIRAAESLGTLDCSHFVDWVYLISADDNLGYCNTDAMIATNGKGSLEHLGTGAEGEAQLKTGDIMVYGHDSRHRYGHTAIFLCYAYREGENEPSMVYVHNSSAKGGVTVHIGSHFGNGGSSPVHYFRYQGKPSGINTRTANMLEIIDPDE